MKYAYYPGCSLKESAREYDFATRVVLDILNAELEEIPEWGCCGASVTESVSPVLALALAARNLALAERALPGGDVLAPCSACYLNLRRAQEELPRDRELQAEVNRVLETEGLSYPGCEPDAAPGRVRHLLDVLDNDVGHQRMAAHVRHDLSHLSVAPYTGCQALRPYRVFDDPERPQVLGRILETLGVTVLPFSHAGRCCGASLLATRREVGLRAVAAVLEAARGADCIVTVCPMCQMNLELYQSPLGLRIPVLYLPQLMGLAFGLSPGFMKLNENLSVPAAFAAALDSREGASEVH